MFREKLAGAHELAKRAQQEAGRSEEGRRWSILITDLEKLDALAMAWNPALTGYAEPP